jgi:drug/metabolite transporter (DMT)-like permease
MLSVMNNPSASSSIFQRPAWVALLAFLAAFSWGWAFPLVKLGFAEFGIAQDMTASKMLFAGLRFGLAGVIILLIALLTGRSFSFKTDHRDGSADPCRKTTVISRTVPTILFLLLFALLNTTLHYAAFYIGLSYSQGARAAILNSMSVFTLVILACIFFKSDKMTYRKLLGCVIGFTGILTLNVGGKQSGAFTLLGDGLIILNALCGAFAGLLTRGVNKRIDVFVGTGYSLAVGGALLIIPSLLMGATLPHVSLWGLCILALLIGISTIGFTLYNKLLTCNPIGKVAIWNSLIPVVGALTSCLCLGETFYPKYIFAAGLATLGIYIINKGKK